MKVGFDGLKAWFVPKNRTPESERILQELSEDQKQHLKQAMAALSAPGVYRDTFTEEIAQAVVRWVEDEDAPNTLALLGAPVEPLEKILTDAIAHLALDNVPTTIQFPSTPTAKPAVRVEQFISELEREPQLVLLPSLSRGFLRCIGGLDGIEALQTAAFRDRSHFWLVGCNSWTWQYLSKTHQLQADFEQTLQLPPLTSDALKMWLAPAATEIDLDLDEEEIQNRFEELARASLGLSRVAGALWIEALRTCDSGIVFDRPKRPKLPDLEMHDRYLLYSLVLHEELAFPQLALSLGEEEHSVRAPLQRLQQLGLVRVDQGLFSLNPSHYPKLLADLGQNNFLVDT
ncbi:MAG: hypothetical protein SVX43_12435 [Cyanobacteriota bacterium]|nr:hypothetical protein [Cyanobacteriota bacterium]